MKKYLKIVFIAVFIALISVNFQFGGPKEAKAEQCYYPFMSIDKMDELYNQSVCQGNYQVYYFPVITDGRKYTITLHSIEGEQKLYASRYKNEVDEFSDFSNWYCYDDHCDSSTEINSTAKIVAFRAPTGEEDGYYSWFAVYGTSESKYQVGVSNNGVLSYLASGGYETSSVADSASTTEENNSGSEIAIKWKAADSENFINLNAIDWTAASFGDSDWKNITLPDGGPWYCDNCYRRYRGAFNLSETNRSFKLSFGSDDGLWIYINGQYIGHWGGDSTSRLMCVNNFYCRNNQAVSDLEIKSYLSQGNNVISAIVYDGGGGSEYFDLHLKRF